MLIDKYYYNRWIIFHDEVGIKKIMLVKNDKWWITLLHDAAREIFDDVLYNCKYVMF